MQFDFNQLLSTNQDIKETFSRLQVFKTSPADFWFLFE